MPSTVRVRAHCDILGCEEETSYTDYCGTNDHRSSELIKRLQEEAWTISTTGAGRTLCPKHKE